MRTTLLTSIALTLSLSACDDPAASVPAATVAPATTPAPAAEARAPDPGGTEQLEVALDRSSVGFTGAKVTGSHDGTFGQFAGTIELDARDLTRSRVRVEMRMDSIAIEPPRLRTHLLGPDFFDVGTFPAATFVSTAIATGAEGSATHTITGDLTLHGQTRSISFPATIEVTDAEVRARAEFSIDRRDFGIVYPGAPDDLIRDGVVIRFDVRAPRG